MGEREEEVEERGDDEDCEEEGEEGGEAREEPEEEVEEEEGEGGSSLKLWDKEEYGLSDVSSSPFCNAFSFSLSLARLSRFLCFSFLFFHRRRRRC